MLWARGLILRSWRSENGPFPPALQPPPTLPSARYAAGPRKPLPKVFQGDTIAADTKRGGCYSDHPPSPDRRLRPGQPGTEDQGNLDTQTKQLQEYGVHEVVPEIGAVARSDRLALRNLRNRLQAGDTLVVTAIDRISRRAVDGLRFIRDVTDSGIHLVVISQREFDTTTGPPQSHLCVSTNDGVHPQVLQ